MRKKNRARNSFAEETESTAEIIGQMKSPDPDNEKMMRAFEAVAKAADECGRGYIFTPITTSPADQRSFVAVAIPQAYVVADMTDKTITLDPTDLFWMGVARIINDTYKMLDKKGKEAMKKGFAPFIQTTAEIFGYGTEMGMF